MIKFMHRYCKSVVPENKAFSHKFVVIFFPTLYPATDYYDLLNN